MPVSTRAPAPGGAAGHPWTVMWCDDCFEGRDVGGPVEVGAAGRSGLLGCRRGRRVAEPGRGPQQSCRSGRVGADPRRGQVRIAHRVERGGQQVCVHTPGDAGHGAADKCGVTGPCGVGQFRGEQGVQALPLDRHVSGEPTGQALVLVGGRFEPPSHHRQFDRFDAVSPRTGRRWSPPSYGRWGPGSRPRQRSRRPAPPAPGRSRAPASRRPAPSGCRRPSAG